MLRKNFNPALIISSNLRSLVYLKNLKKEYYLPNQIVFLKDKKESFFNTKILSFLKKNKKKVYLKIFHTTLINDLDVSNYLKNLNNKIFIASLYPGREGIIKNKLLLKKKLFLHSHTGKLPKYKGSTTIYYSLLMEKKIWCDTFFLSEKIDQGVVIYSKKYPIPKSVNSIDNDYDAKIRILNLISALKILSKKKVNFRKRIKKNKNFNFSYYYIMHPILRLLTLNKIKNV